jgi:hypothetical protein
LRFSIDGEPFGAISNSPLVRCFYHVLLGHSNEENIMKASTNNGTKGKFHEVKRETNERLRKLMNDPTLEGKDENKVGFHLHYNVIFPSRQSDLAFPRPCMGSHIG